MDASEFYQKRLSVVLIIDRFLSTMIILDIIMKKTSIILVLIDLTQTLLNYLKFMVQLMTEIVLEQRLSKLEKTNFIGRV